MRIIKNISNGWLFKKGAWQNEKDFKDFSMVDLPHTWNAYDGQDGGADYYRGKGTYVYKLFRPDTPEGYLHYLEFKGANAIAQVFLDGKEVCEHKGGYSTFRVEITKEIKDKPFVLVSVVVDNADHSDVYPQMADFTFYGGLYREVELISVPPTHLDLEYFSGPGFQYTSRVVGDDAYVDVAAWIKNPYKQDMVRFCLSNDSGETVCEKYERAEEMVKASLFIENAHLWQGVKDPYLYNLEISIVRNNETLDMYGCDVGIRYFSVDPEKGFFLNGCQMPLRGVSRHQDKLMLGNALNEEDHYIDCELISEIGANTIRLAHYQHSQTFYTACDEYGFVVWAEIPFISVMSMDKAAHENAMLQMKELIIQNFNHPSICFWGISNEITIGGEREGLVENLKELNSLAKKLDPTRLTTMAQVSMLPINSEQNDITDVVSYNHYFGWYGGSLEDNEKWVDNFHQKYPNRCLGLSEYGAEGIISWHSDDPKCKDYSEEYQAKYHEHMADVISRRPYLWATHVWNMFDFGCDARDEGGVKGRNNKGLMTIDREIRKDAFYVYKAYWSDDQFVHIAGRRYSQRPYDKMDVKVYSNQNEVTLFSNGKEIGTQKGSRIFIFKDVPLQDGNNTIKAVGSSGASDTVIFTRVKEPVPGYIMPEDPEDKEDGVKNWFDDLDVDAPTPELTFDESCFSINDKIKDIFENEDAGCVVSSAISKFTGKKIKKSMLMVMANASLKDIAGIAGGSRKQEVDRMLGFMNSELQKIKK